jgi:hypothetical protein
MKIGIQVEWDWTHFCFGLAYDKPYKSLIIVIGFLAISIDKENI